MEGSSSLSLAYSDHVSAALVFYEGLLHKLKQEFGLEQSKLSQLNGISTVCLYVCAYPFYKSSI